MGDERDDAPSMREGSADHQKEKSVPKKKGDCIGIVKKLVEGKKWAVAVVRWLLGK